MIEYYRHGVGCAARPATSPISCRFNGSPLGMGLSWWPGKDDFGDYFFHDGGGAGFEDTMRFYPDLDLGVLVTASVFGYQKDKIVEGLVSAWQHEK